jgi:predicted PurR-regulated permease PerM
MLGFMSDESSDSPLPAAARPKNLVGAVLARPGQAFLVGFLLVLGGGMGWWLLQGIDTLSTVVTYVAIAFFITLGLDPIVRFLAKRGIKRSIAVVIVAVAFLLVVTGVLLLIVPTLVAQIQAFIGNLPTIIGDIAEQEWVKDLESRFGGSLDVDTMVANATTWASDPQNLVSVGGGLVSVGSTIANGTTGVIIVLILTVYFSATLPTIKSWAFALVPASRRAGTESVAEEIMRSVGGYVLGQVSLAAINGVLSAVFLVILQAPLPALLALIAFIGSMIPLVGTLSASVVIVVSCLFVSPTMAIIAGIYYLVYMQIESYVFSPRIMRAAVNVPGALVIIGAVAGATIAGVLGALLAVPVTASLLIIIRRVVVPHQAAR